jgi:hypothetical protein
MAVHDEVLDRNPPPTGSGFQVGPIKIRVQRLNPQIAQQTMLTGRFERIGPRGRWLPVSTAKPAWIVQPEGTVALEVKDQVIVL